MKKLSYLLIALSLLVSGAFISCNKVKDLLETTIEDVQFDADIEVTESITKVDGVAFGGAGIINPASNPDIEAYLDNIRGVDVKEIKITVLSVTPTSGLDLLDVSFTISDNTNTFTYTRNTSTPIVAGTEFIIDSSTPNFSEVSDILSAMHTCTVSALGHVSESPFELSFNYSITADVTVGVAK